ncbi:coiled-coil domain-containing protein 180 [Labrus mixtus]|uniref:coiled-coil domain-containing protein 180 n=1 Tax=Labrus mixtus TaxID=508554 RepID=UPI0029BFEC07|nr:coiled-coil domain-containing protein 180 [Labrus mixtus]
MSESRAVPSGKVYRQLFDAQVQLSRSLLAGRKDTRTDCLSAEDSNTRCSTTSRLLCPPPVRGQKGDDADEVDDVSQLPDSVYETQVRTVSVELLSSLQGLNFHLDTLKDKMKYLEHQKQALQDVYGLWEEVEEEVKKKKLRIKGLNKKLTEAESQRTDQIRVVLQKYSPLLEKISFLPPSDVYRLIHNEATMLNQSLLANRRSVARLLLLLREETLQQESLLCLHWEDCLSRWRSNTVSEVIGQYRSLCCSDTDQEPLLVRQAVQKMKQTQQELTAKRCDIINSICTLVPPSCSISLVSDWFNHLTAVNQQIERFNTDFLHELRCCYDQTRQDRLADMERCKKEILTFQLSEEEVNDVVSSQLLPLIGQSQSQYEERLAAYDVCCELVSNHAHILSKCVFVLMRGATLLWEAHSSRLKTREEEVQQHLDDLRESQQHYIQKKKVRLDVLLGVLRQEGNEDSLKMSLDKAVFCLKEVQESCRDWVSDQCQLLDRLPSLLLEELFSYSSSLSLFYHLNHTYRPVTMAIASHTHLHLLLTKSPEELQKLHPSLTNPADHEYSQGAEIQKPNEMIKNHQISCQIVTDPDQSSQYMLPEDESCLEDLCDMSNIVTFASSRGVSYSGPIFTCPAPDLSEYLQQETHLPMFPVELLPHTLNRMRILFLENLEQHFHDVLSSAVTMVTHRKEVLHCEQEFQLQQLNRQHIQTHIYQPRLAELQLHRQRVDVHCEEVSDVLASCRTELHDLQTSINRKNKEFTTTVSNMEDDIMTAESSQRLDAVSSALQDCLDQHIKDTQHCQTTFRKTVQIRLEEVRQKITQLLNSFRLFSEAGDFAPEEVKLFQQRLKGETKKITLAEESIHSDLEGFESKSLLQVKDVSGRFEEILSLLKSEVTFMEKIKKIISSTQVNIKAEAASSNQQQAAILSRLEDLRRMVENTQQVSSDKVCSFLSSVSEEFRKRCQYLDFSLDHTWESLPPRPKSTKRVCSAQPSGLLQPSRKAVDLLNDPVVGIIKSLNRLRINQDLPAEAAEREEGGRAASGQSSVQRLQQKCTGSVSNLSVGRGYRPIRSDRRLQVFGPKPDPEQTTHSLSSAVNSVLWKANDVILLVAEDFYRSKRGSRFLLVPESFDQWAEGMQQRLLGYQEQARKLISTSREELVNQLSMLEEILNLLSKVLISNHVQQHEAGLRNEVGRVRIKLEQTLLASEKEKRENVRHLRVSLRDDELQTLNRSEDLRQQQLQSAICSAHLQLQECVRARGEEFVKSLASLTDSLLHQLDNLFTAADTEAAPIHQHSEESNVTLETGDETGQKLCSEGRTVSGTPYLMPPTDSTADPPSATIATTASISTTRCTSVHVAVIELRDVAVKRLEQLLKSESSCSDDDKGRQLSELQRWSTQWKQQIHSLKHTH